MTKLLKDTQDPPPSCWWQRQQSLNSLTIQHEFRCRGHDLFSLPLQGLMSLDEFLKRNFLPLVHPTVCRSHRSSVIRITLINEVLEERSHMELLILRHLGDLLGDLGD
ncbi:MAG: hypothetical protein ACKVY0_03100 [Prosthecobacter sp.]